MAPDAAHHFLVLTYVALAAVFAIFAMRTFAAARLSRRRGADTPPAADSPLAADVAEIKTRLAAVEMLLREVG